jgi:peroxiredoxin
MRPRRRHTLVCSRRATARVIWVTSAGAKVVLFVVPAAFAGPCSTGHVPSFARNAAAMKAKGVSKIVCMAVDNPYAINGWVKSMGKNAEGV